MEIPLQGSRRLTEKNLPPTLFTTLNPMIAMPSTTSIVKNSSTLAGISAPLLKLSRFSKTSNGPSEPYDLEVASSDCTRGSVAVTEVPLPRFEVMLKRPPEFAMRWDIPDSPNLWFVIDPTTKPHPLSFTERRTVVGDALSST